MNTMLDMKRQIIISDYKTYDVICTYYSEDYDKDYVIYTDGTKGEDDKLNVYYGSYTLTNDDFDVKCITDDNEEKMIISVLESIIEEVNKK